MAEWLFDQAGAPCVVLDEECVRNGRGVVIAWVGSGSVYLLHGQNVGWFEGGVIYDNMNCALAYSRNRTGYLPGGSAMRSAPPVPALAPVPAKPSFAPAPPRPGRGGWSRHPAGGYFAA